DRLSSYRIMWIFVIFDLPTDTERARKAYVRFRNGLLDDGFGMMQYSVYVRHCASKESMEVHIRRVKSMIPNEGRIAIMQVTDKQFGSIEHLWGKAVKDPPKAPSQLE